MNRKKPLFRLGPWTTLAMAGAIVVAYVRFPAWQREAEQTRQLEVTRAQLAHQGKTKAPPLHSLQTLWDERAALRLTSSQLEAVQKLRVREAGQIAPLKRTAELARRDLDKWMKAHQNGAALADIQQQSTIYSAASAPLTQERERFWRRGLSLLSPAQRARLQTQVQPQL